MAWELSLKKEELSEGTGQVIEVKGRSIALFQIQGNVYALDNSCLHRGGPLGEGEIEEGIVTCPWHGFEYEVATGQCKTAPGKLKTYPVKVEGEEIYIDVQ